MFSSIYKKWFFGDDVSTQVLQVTDNDGATASDSIDVVVENLDDNPFDEVKKQRKKYEKVNIIKSFKQFTYGE